MRKKVVFIGVILFALLALGWAFWVWLGAGGTDADAGALTLYGNVDVRQVHLGFRVGGKIAEALVDEGDSVSANAHLSRLDTVPLEEALAGAEARLAGARAAFEKARNGPRPGEIAQARAIVAQAGANLTLAELTARRYERLVQTRAAAQAALDEAVATRDVAKGRLSESAEALSLLEEGTRYEDVDAARAEMYAAEAALSSARTQLEDANLYAPGKGMITSRVREPGAVVGAGEAVFVLTLDEPVWVRAYVPEPMLGRVASGLTVDVFSDTQPDRAYKGRVGFVSPVAEFTPKTVETPDLRTDLVYRLRIVIDAPDTGLRQGMPVTVRVPPPGGRAPD